MIAAAHHASMLGALVVPGPVAAMREARDAR